MNQRSLLAAIFLPVAVAFFALSGSPETKPLPAGAPKALPPYQPAKKKSSSPGQTAKPLKSACDLLGDYFDIPGDCPSFESRSTDAVMVTISGPLGKALSATVSGSGTSALADQNDADEKAKSTSEKIRERWREFKTEAFFVFVPDPNASTLGLETDRALDAVRLALSDADFVPYKSTELPWRAGGPDLDKNGAKRGDEEANGKEAKPANPGVWLFRSGDPRKKRLALVFLIGESPVVGVSKPQFRGAIEQYLTYVQPTAHVFKLIGPVFSGSVDSIANALRAEGQVRAARVPSDQLFENASIRAVSGTTSLPGLEIKLQELLPKKNKNDITLVQLDDTAAFNEMKAALGDKDKIAVIREADTAYGEGVQGTTQSVSGDFKYSRGLLHLRVAYDPMST